MGLIRARDRRAPSLLPSAPPKAPVSLVPISVRSRRIGHRLFKRRLRTSCVCATPSQWKRSVPRRHAAPPPQASSPQASPGRRAWMSDQRHRWFPVEPPPVAHKPPRVPSVHGSLPPGACTTPLGCRWENYTGILLCFMGEMQPFHVYLCMYM